MISIIALVLSLAALAACVFNFITLRHNTKVVKELLDDAFAASRSKPKPKEQGQPEQPEDMRGS